MRSCLVLALVAGVAALAGCSSKSVREGGKVTGKVTQNGNPVADAKVVFTEGNAAGGAANGPTAITDESGAYVLVGVKPGTYKVVIYKLIAKKGATLPAEGEGMDLEQIEASGLGSHALPKKFSTSATTTLTATVGDGATEADFKVDGK